MIVVYKQNKTKTKPQFSLTSFPASSSGPSPRSSSSWAPWRCCSATAPRTWSCGTGSGGASSPRWAPGSPWGGTHGTKRSPGAGRCRVRRSAFNVVNVGEAAPTSHSPRGGTPGQRRRAAEGEREADEGGRGAGGDGEEAPTGTAHQFPLSPGRRCAIPRIGTHPVNSK